MKLPETVAEVENLTQRFLEHHGFPQCIGAIDGTHIAIRQPNQNYADCINRKGFTSVNVRALCDYRYCFLDVVMRWPGSVHDSRIFLQSNLNQKLWNKFVPSCEKQIVKGEMKVHNFYKQLEFVKVMQFLFFSVKCFSLWHKPTLFYEQPAYKKLTSNYHNI